MRTPTVRALVVLLPILWAINAEAVTRDDGDGPMSINVTPSCIVVGAPVEFVVVNTDLPMDDAEGATLVLVIENDENKKVYSTFTEADGKGELVAKFPFGEVAAHVSGMDEAWFWFYVIYPDGEISAYDYVKVHDYQTTD